MEQLKKWIWNKKKTTTETGKFTEQFAAEYLTSHNLTFVMNNFHSKYGEIDLIMLDNQTYVFIEVKYRKNNLYGGAEVAVNYNKQQKLRLCAQYYLQKNQLNEYTTPCRFDIVALEGDIQTPTINWLKNAF